MTGQVDNASVSETKKMKPKSETDSGLKAKKKKMIKKKQVKANAMNKEKQLNDVKCLEAGDANHKLVEDGPVRSKVKGKQPAVNEPMPADKCQKKRKRIDSEDEFDEEEPRVWTTPSGVVVEDLVPGHPFGEMALPGKKLSIHYFGKWEGTNWVFITTNGYPPLKFRLGCYDATRGWNEGLIGIRAGGKRRLTVPIPGSRGLVYEIKVLRVS